MSTKVSDSTGYTGNIQMSVFGYILAVVMVIVLLPLLPVFAVAWLIFRLFRMDEEVEPNFASWRDNKGKPPSDTD